MYFYVRGIKLIFPLSTILIFELKIVPTAWYFLFLHCTKLKANKNVQMYLEDNNNLPPCSTPPQFSISHRYSLSLQCCQVLFNNNLPPCSTSPLFSISHRYPFSLQCCQVLFNNNLPPCSTSPLFSISHRYPLSLQCCQVQFRLEVFDFCFPTVNNKDNIFYCNTIKKKIRQTIL